MRTPGQRTSSKSWSRRAQSRALLARLTTVVDNDQPEIVRFNLADLCDSFHAHRLWTVSTCKFAYDGSAALEGDLETLADSHIVGAIERDESDLSQLVPANSTFSLTRADFSSGDWVFVMANRDGELRRVALK